MPETTPIKDKWDKAKIVAEILKIGAVICVGIIINTSLQNRELDLRYVQLAVGILQAEPTEDSQHLRNWATDIINVYSEIDLNEDAKNELRQKQLIIVPLTDDLWISDEMEFTDDGVIMEYEEYKKMHNQKLDSEANLKGKY